MISQLGIMRQGGSKNQVWFKPNLGFNNENSNSKSFLMSPQHNIEKNTKPSVLGTSNNTSFELNCFSFNNEETAGSGYYALIGIDG